MAYIQAGAWPPRPKQRVGAVSDCVATEEREQVAKAASCRADHLAHRRRAAP